METHDIFTFGSLVYLNKKKIENIGFIQLTASGILKAHPGHYVQLYKKLRQDPVHIFNYFRMNFS